MFARGDGRDLDWHDSGVQNEDATSPERVGLPAAAWSLYDFGYSLFAYVVFARYLSDWVITDLGHPDWVITSGQVVAALTLVLLMPLAGVAADVIGRHTPLLAMFTIITVCAGIGLGLVDPTVGTFGVLPLVGLGVIAAVGTSLAFAQFDPMLAAVAPHRHWNVVSGIAVAAGFLGIITWLLVLHGKFVGEGDKQHAFIPAAVIFLVMSLPVLLFAHEARRETSGERIPARRLFRVAREQQRGALERLR
jgi:UMF1 family MFS transporter